MDSDSWIFRKGNSDSRNKEFGEQRQCRVDSEGAKGAVCFGLSFRPVANPGRAPPGKKEKKGSRIEPRVGFVRGRPPFPWFARSSRLRARAGVQELERSASAEDAG